MTSFVRNRKNLIPRVTITNSLIAIRIRNTAKNVTMVYAPYSELFGALEQSK